MGKIHPMTFSLVSEHVFLCMIQTKFWLIKDLYNISNNSRWGHNDKITKLTRMHSSRMHTARSLTVSRCIPHTPPCHHAHPLCHHHTCPPLPQMPPSLPPCMPPITTHVPSATTHAPLVDRMTDMCKNITFANFVCGR